MSERDTSVYMKKIKQKGSETETVMEKIKSDRLAELDKLRIDAEMEEVRAKAAENRARITKSQQEGQPLPQPQTQDAMAAMGKTMLEAVRTGVEVSKPQASSNSNVESMAKAFADVLKTGVEIGKGQNPAQPQSNVYETLVKSTLEELKATREQMATQERLKIEKEIAELRARPSGIDDLLYNEEKVSRARKIFGGTDSATANEFTLKKEDMQQKERLETRRMDLEEKALDHKLATEGKTIDQITNFVKTVSEGPVGDAIKMIGGAQADKMRGSVANSNSPRIVRIKCPGCGGIFAGNEQLATLACPLCGAGLTRASQPAPQEAQPQAIQSPEKTQESQAQTEQPPVEGQSVAEQPANQQ
ncbi:hypothetical protein MUP79_08215 [Candidatus Bathyarchaeota archaeon]|nr:hypothetical protein [Candidatus Bathyarchaeota archaeon]